MAISRTGQVSYNLDELIKLAQIDNYFGPQTNTIFEVFMAHKRAIIELKTRDAEMLAADQDFTDYKEDIEEND